MLRRCSILLIALFMIFTMSSCKVKDEDNTVAPSVEEAPVTVEETPAAVEETMAEPSTFVILPNGVLPDSGYNRHNPPERYYENTVLDIIPTDNYGRIWPYIGGYYDSMMGTQSEMIGICDDNGKIICDAAYNDAILIENGENKLYAFTKYNVNIKGEQRDEYYITTFTALDGSWAETFELAFWGETSSFEYSTIIDPVYGFSSAYQWRDTVNYDYITAKHDGRWGILGWDGSVLLPFEYLEPVCFYEGLAAVLSEERQEYSFIDITGKVVLGPFEVPPKPAIEYSGLSRRGFITDKIMFYDGYAKFYEDGKYGIIDHSGKVIIPAVYDFITCMNGGMAMFVEYSQPNEAEQLKEAFGVINDLGSVIIEPVPLWISHNNETNHALIWNGIGPAEKVAYDGTRSLNEDEAPFIDDDSFVFKNGDVKLSTQHYYIEYVSGNLVIMFDRDNSTWQLYDYDGKPVSAKNPGHADYSSNYGASKEFFSISLPDSPLIMLYGLDGKALLEGAYLSIIPIGGRYMVRGKTTAGLVDENGNFILEVYCAAYNAD